MCYLNQEATKKHYTSEQDITHDYCSHFLSYRNRRRRRIYRVERSSPDLAILAPYLGSPGACRVSRHDAPVSVGVAQRQRQRCRKARSPQIAGFWRDSSILSQKHKDLTMTKTAQAKAPATVKANPSASASVDPAEILAEIQRQAGDRDLADCASGIAKKLNKAKKLPCPTGGRSHPARPGFTYWIGSDVEAFVAKHS